MISSDPEKRSQVHEQVIQILVQRTCSEDRDLVLGFAGVDLAETPDRIAMHLAPEALAERILSHYRFIARTIPPSIQLYRGLPGIHVSVRRPSEQESLAMGAGGGFPLESTLVETHTPDVPFIFDSLKNYFAKAGLRVFTAVHPIFTVHRQWERITWIGGPHEEGSREVYCCFEIEPLDSAERFRRMEHEIFCVLKSVILAVEDFPEMLRSTAELADRLRSHPGRQGDLESARAFLDWLTRDNYIFMGMTRYAPAGDGGLEQVADTVHGVYSDPSLLPVVFPGFIDTMESDLIPASDDGRIIDIDYRSNAAAIYHLEPIDAVVIREWSPEGPLAGITLLIGRFARSALLQRADRIPLLREKVEWIVRESGAVPDSHIHRELVTTFNRLPMCELFFAPADSLKSLIQPIVFMLGDDDISIKIRSGRSYYALSIAYSRLRYSYETEKGLLQALAEAFGPISFQTSADCGATTVFLCYFDAAQLTRPLDSDAILRTAQGLLSSWETRVATALERAFGEREGRRLFRRYVRFESRSGLYREVTPPGQVPEDVRRFESLTARLEARIQPLSPESTTLHLYSTHAMSLSDTLRTLGNAGLVVREELRIPLILPEGRKCFLYRFQIDASPSRIRSLVQGEGRFVEALRALDEGRATDGPLNALIIDAAMTWREVELLRTIRNHLLQIRPHYNSETINGIMLRNIPVVKAMFRLFAAKCDPGLKEDRTVELEQAEAALRTALESVRNLAEDEVLRCLVNLVRAAVRTNFYQLPERPVFSIKVHSRQVEGMPSPRPLYEIYVHSRLLEGIHLRGGKVARGGIRWSDRHDDFRTEILGLMKTQMVKNSIIVPVGSKGGFVLKGDVPARPALDSYLVDRYREFISGLLDVTDNLAEGRVIHPPEVVRHDDPDPYLVVAADKGTAHLSDTANRVSAQYGFWLGDAFASGGSVGYDHKKVGITARGAWECIKHHFRNLGKDAMREPFTACGIGDMSGDVFGNGMIESRATKLIAAFNHVHIFVDPDPDPESSFLERKRLFALPRSSWRDYDTSIISRGGGVFDRAAKAIPVSAEMGRVFDISSENVSGEELIRRILTARVDLLYNGGIGTYVKASNEEDAEVGDRANDRVRVTAGNVRAAVIAEGGNLGITQQGRLEYWAGGGSINTDAVDNSGGVDMSDHEVNIKILLDLLLKKGAIPGKTERNRLLAEMTDEVAQLVLADNEKQARALTLDGLRSVARYSEFLEFVDDLVRAGLLQRADENIPMQDELLASPKRERGLPRPLLAVLLGYSKMWAFQMLLQSDLPDSRAAHPFLVGYFPRILQERFVDHFEAHTLRREIVATAVANHIINCGGMILISRLMKDTGSDIGRVAEAYLNAEREGDGDAIRAGILEAAMQASEEHQALLELEAQLESWTRDLLTGRAATEPAERLRALRDRFGP